EQRAAEERTRREQQAALDRQREELARLKSEMDRVRGAAGTGRDQAAKAEADKLARDLFDAARAKESQADSLAARQAFAEATAAYRDAAQGYDSALKRATVLRQERAEA